MRPNCRLSWLASLGRRFAAAFLTMSVDSACSPATPIALAAAARLSIALTIAPSLAISVPLTSSSSQLMASAFVSLVDQRLDEGLRDCAHRGSRR